MNEPAERDTMIVSRMGFELASSTIPITIPTGVSAPKMLNRTTFPQVLKPDLVKAVPRARASPNLWMQIPRAN